MSKLTKIYRFVCLVKTKTDSANQIYHYDLVVESWEHNPDTLLEIWDAFITNPKSYVTKENERGHTKVMTLSDLIVDEYHLLCVQEISTVTHSFMAL